MKLWLEASCLLALLLVSSSALAPECEELVKPLSLDDHSKLYGRRNLLLGYADHDSFKVNQKGFESYWMNVKASPAGAGHVLMTQANKINGTCIGSVVNVTVEGNTAKMIVPGLSGEYKVLPSCDGCLLYWINATISNMGKFLQMPKVEATTDVEKFHAHALYLMANETTVKDSDLEHFKKQAHCLGFSGEPNFHYNPDKSFCEEGNGSGV